MKDELVRAAQNCIRAVPVIVLGSGASMDQGMPGMGELSEHLLKTVADPGLTPEDTAAWEKFSNVIATTDLENALQQIQMGRVLNDHIIIRTWYFIRERDDKIFANMLKGTLTLPLAKLLKWLFRSTHMEVQIVTTNYDLLAEYAVELSGFCHYTGFSFGHLRPWQGQPITLHQSGKAVRIAHIWKVHGSLDWFERKSDAQVVALPRSEDLCFDLKPLIVTPGLEKYRKTHLDPFRWILAEADRALVGGRSYLCIGYGFNDWPAAGFADTELGVLMEPEVGHGETEVYAGVQA